MLCYVMLCYVMLLVKPFVSKSGEDPADSRNVSFFKFLYGGQLTLSTQSLNPKLSCAIIDCQQYLTRWWPRVSGTVRYQAPD